MRRARALALIALLAWVLAACARPTPAPTPYAGLQVTVSIVPQQYFVQRIGGEHVRVNVMVLPGANPATYEPKPEQLKALSQADAYFSIGVAFENAWLGRIAAANPKMELVDTAQGIERLPLAEHHHEGEQALPADDHAEGNLDPHIWTSPRLVAVQAATIHATLVRLDPAHTDDYDANLNAFLADIETLDQEIRATLQSAASAKFMVFHPSWGYFAADYGLEQIPVEIGGQEPSAKELAELIAEAQEEQIRVVFAQPEFSTRAAETIAREINGEVLLISPLAEDWPTNLRQVAQTMADTFKR